MNEDSIIFGETLRSLFCFKSFPVSDNFRDDVLAIGPLAAGYAAVVFPCFPRTAYQVQGINQYCYCMKR